MPSADSELCVRTVTPLGTLTIILPKWGGKSTSCKKTNTFLRILQNWNFILKECSVAATKSSTKTKASGKIDRHSRPFHRHSRLSLCHSRPDRESDVSHSEPHVILSASEESLNINHHEKKPPLHPRNIRSILQLPEK